MKFELNEVKIIVESLKIMVQVLSNNNKRLIETKSIVKSNHTISYISGEINSNNNVINDCKKILVNIRDQSVKIKKNKPKPKIVKKVKK